MTAAQSRNSDSPVVNNFYAVFLLCLLITGDLNEAKYLWKRIPAALKVSPQRDPTISSRDYETAWTLSVIWEIGKSMWKEDMSLALHYLRSCTALDQSSSENMVSGWSELLQPLVTDLYVKIFRDYLKLLQRGYSKVDLPLITRLLSLNIEDARRLIRDIGWQEIDGVVVPCANDEIVQNSTTINEGMYYRLFFSCDFLCNLMVVMYTMQCWGRYRKSRIFSPI